MAESLLQTGQYEKDAVAPGNIDDLIQELHIYHAELEIQNQQLRRTQEQLEQASRRYQTLFELAPTGYAVLDSKGTVLEINEQARIILQYDAKAELVSSPFSLLLAGRDRMTWQRHLQAVLTSQTPNACEVELRSRQGQPVNVLIVSRQLPEASDNGPGAQRILVSLTDISARKCAEAELRALQSRFEAFMSHLPAGAFLVDDQGRARFVNRFLAETFGARQMSEGQPGRLAEDADLHRVLAEASEESENLQAIDRQNGKRIIRVERFGVRLSDRSLLRAGIVLDITDLEQAEKHRRLVERQLRQSLKLEAIGRLAGGMAHDFNNQLTVIQGYCELLGMDQDLPGRCYKQIDEIRHAARRAHRLTDQLLSFSRRQILVPEFTDVNDEIAGLLGDVKRLAGGAISVEWRPDETLDPLEIDRGQLRHAVMAMAQNAVDAMGDGGQLAIRTGRTELTTEDLSASEPAQPGRFVWIEVADTGCGMNPTVQANIFEPFYTTKEIGQGVGLGLSMVHGFVLQSGGTVTVDSEPGQGSTFRVYLPYNKPAQYWDMISPRSALPGGEETLLLIESDPRALAMLTTCLREIGYTVLEALDADEAVRLARGEVEPIDLLVVSESLRTPADQIVSRLGGHLKDGRVLHVDTRGHGQGHGDGDGAGSITRRLADGVRRILDRDD
jgi:PAS domain S-box-containing protein